MEAGNPIKYLGMEMGYYARNLLETNAAEFASMCNGVGSTVGLVGGLTYHMIPNTIWGVDITPASDIHDVEGTIPIYYSTMERALAAWLAVDVRFHRNVCFLIEHCGHPAVIKSCMRRRADFYFWCLRNFGRSSFFSGKTIGEEL